MSSLEERILYLKSLHNEMQGFFKSTLTPDWVQDLLKLSKGKRKYTEGNIVVHDFFDHWKNVVVAIQIIGDCV